MKRLHTVLIVISVVLMLSLFFFNRLQQDPISPDQAKQLAEQYVRNAKQHLKLPTAITNTDVPRLDKTFMNTLTGTSTWNVSVDGTFVELNAYTGRFIRMVFPSEGMISYEEHPEWFQLNAPSRYEILPEI